MSVEQCDVLIVGGGPAGSSCARQLRGSGLDVLVMDKASFPRDKVCAGWITPQVVTSLQLDLTDYTQHRVLQPIRSFATALIGDAPRHTHYSAPVSYAIRRCEFDDYLLRRSGARLYLGEPLRSLVRTAGGWLANGSIQAAMIVGAGGHFCKVAALMGANVGRDEHAISAQEVEFKMSDSQAAQCQVTGDSPEIYWCQDLRGYGWCVRKGLFLNIGLGHEDNRELHRHILDFHGRLARDRGIPTAAELRYKGHAYLLYGSTPRPTYENACLLIGDALGLAYPQSGEGIRPAIESGLIAAQVIVEAARDYRAERLAAYAARLETRLGPRRFARAAPHERRLRNALGRRLLRNRYFVRHAVLDRWFLHRQQAAL
jgi:menaquinone-9 beta-reductase